MLKKLLIYNIIILMFLLYGCAPGAITPNSAYGGDALTVGPYPPSTRAGHFDQSGFYLSAGPSGLGLEVAAGVWRGALYGGYAGVNIRNSWSQDSFGVSLDTAYNIYPSSNWVDADGDGYGEYVTSYHETLGAAIDGTYYFPIETDIGAAYVGPRVRAYFACESADQSGYICGRYGVLPGGTLGVNVPISAISEKLIFGVEGSVFIVVPGITDSTRFSVFSPFAFSLSYRF